MRTLKIGFLMVFVFALATAALGFVSADDDEPTVTTDIEDTRVNYWEVGAPVAVYCTFETPDADDPDYSEFSGIELLAINPETNNGENVAAISAEEIEAAGVNEAEDTLLVSGSGYSLYRAKTGEFYVVSPADAEGKVYTFVFERGDLNC